MDKFGVKTFFCYICSTGKTYNSNNNNEKTTLAMLVWGGDVDG